MPGMAAARKPLLLAVASGVADDLTAPAIA